MERQTQTTEQPNPPSSEDGFSEPVERPWGNLTPQESTVSPATALLVGKDGGTGPAASIRMYQEQVTSPALR